MSDLISHRRDFVRALALGASTSLVAACPARPQEPVQEPPDPVEAEVDARMSLIVNRYGDRLDDTAREEIRREVTGIVRRGRSLREYPLDNGDGPASVWIPYRAPLAREG